MFIGSDCKSNLTRKWAILYRDEIVEQVWEPLVKLKALLWFSKSNVYLLKVSQLSHSISHYKNFIGGC